MPPRKQALLKLTGSEQLSKLESLSKAEKKALHLKEQIVGEWQRKPMSAKAFLEYVKHYYHQTISYPTLNRWKKAYEEGGILTLLDTRGRQAKETQKITGWIAQKIEKEFWLSYGEVKPKHLWRDIHATAYHKGLIQNYEAIVNPKKRKAGQPWQMVSCSTVNRYLKRLQGEQAKALDFLKNPDKAHSKYSPAFGNMAESIQRVNELWEIDSSPFDVMTLKLGKKGQELEGQPEQFRHTLISIVDVKSRVAMVRIFERSNALAVVRLLAEAIEKLGLPESIRMDNGKDYLSKHVQESLRSLGIYPYFGRAFKGEDKPFVERTFRTIQHDFSERLQGFLGHDVAQRVAREARVAKEDRLQGKKTQLTELERVERVQTLLAEWLEHSYQHRLHTGLGMSPFEAFQAGAKDIRRVNKELLVYALGERAENKAVGKKGIRHQNIFYQSPELTPHLGLRVNLRIDLGNIRQAYVFSPAGQYLCMVRDSGHAPLSAEERKEGYKHYQKHLKVLKSAQKAASNYLPEEQGTMIERELAVAKQALQGQDIATMGEATPRTVRPTTPTLPQMIQEERLAMLEMIQKQAKEDALRREVQEGQPLRPPLKIVAPEEPSEDERAIRLRMIAATRH